ncbi:DUF423 domain-containing protein [Phreatobacter sp. AB_2022a]|uniref:DUF423 domain-containing protein n=1 Tax=Phreatobacter sp. AB_2022a TaxID=3003134 RepID=UPI0022871C7D|nr:DUF423 domain-containing protein [Phreatobacter sp. AB_2022a]MCZ0736049.1 DUF423 domain-containing protein [Phreatobacter sp. AB_2022a]
MPRLVACLAGLIGAAGVALAALSTHAYAGTSLNVAASMLSLHAPALLAIAFGRGTGMLAPRLADMAAAALILGLLLFAGDLAWRAFAGSALFPMAAPTGGVLLIGGWLVAALSGLAGRSDRA